MSSPAITPFQRHSGKLAIFVWVMNHLGAVFLPPRNREVLPKDQIRTLAVAKTDHLGDLLTITPVLAAIRRELPSSHLILVVGKWNAALARELLAQGLCSEVVIYSPWGLNRGTPLLRSLWEDAVSFIQARAQLRRRDVDLYLDLRVRSFNSFLLGRMAGAHIVAGFSGREFSTILDLPLINDTGKPLGQLFLDSLLPLGLAGGTYEGPCFHCRQATDFVRDLRQSFPNYAIVHGVSVDRGRVIPSETLLLALNSLPPGQPVLLLGSAKEKAAYDALPLAAHPHWVNLAGKTTLDDLFGLAESARAAIVSDSFVAHLCLAFRVPAVILMVAETSQRNSFPADPPQCAFVDVANPDKVCAAVQVMVSGAVFG